MVEKEVTINNETGVHARPASMLVKLAMSYKNCSIKIIKNGTEADAKSIMNILSLAITQKSVLTIRAEGENEEEAVEKIINLIEKEIH